MPPHTHPYSEVVTIISGDIGTSHGEKFEKKGEMLKPGSLWVYPAKHAHYAWTGNEEATSKFSSLGQEASITSTRLMTRARRQTEVDPTILRTPGGTNTHRIWKRTL